MRILVVLRIYLLSLPRKSEKSVKIGNRKPYEEPLIWGGHPGRDIRREQVRGDTPTPHMQSLLASVFPPPKGAMGPGRSWRRLPTSIPSLGLGPWLPWHPEEDKYLQIAKYLWALAHGPHGTPP